ncbi:MAG: hypothetical protein ACJ77I_12630, partial [Chloroflexota bacterium]
MAGAAAAVCRVCVVPDAARAGAGVDFVAGAGLSAGAGVAVGAGFGAAAEAAVVGAEVAAA